MLAKRITKWRRRIAFLLLSIPDQCIVSTALTDELTHRRTKPPGCAEDATGGCVQ